MLVSFNADPSALLAAFDAAGEALGDAGSGPAADGWDEAGAIAALDQAQQFDRNSAGDGDWPPLKESSEREKSRKGRSRGGILEGDGSLRRSLNRGDPRHVSIRLPDGILEGTADPVAVFHQYGTASLPIRRVVNAPTPEAETRMRRAAAAGVAAALRQAFRP